MTILKWILVILLSPLILVAVVLLGAELKLVTWLFGDVIIFILVIVILVAIIIRLFRK